MRIIGGHWRGTRLPVADIAGLRPSSDRVRETLFNWLQPKLPGARVLDLFAGSGVLGLEALSRGAGEALLVERDPRLVESLQATVERLQAGDRAHVLRADAITLLRTPLHGRFDLVLLDPPFDSDLWAAAIALLPPWLTADAWLYLESPVASMPVASMPTASTSVLSSAVPGMDWLPHRQGRTREVQYGLYRRASSGAATLAAASDHNDDNQ